MMKRRAFLHLAVVTVAAGAALLSGTMAFAQAYPERPVRWIIGAPAGSPIDAVARKIGDGVGAAIGQQVVIDNKPGASGIIALGEAKNAPADGYTFVLGIRDHFTANAVLFKTLPYDPVKDFTYIGKVASGGSILVADPALPAGTVAELVALAKSKPGQVSYGSWGNGSLPQILMEALQKKTGTQFNHVPYRGSPPSIQDILGKTLNLGFTAPVVGKQLIADGKLKPIAYLGATRTPLLPNVPTFAEAGYTDAVFTTPIWIALAGPAGLPADRVAKMSAALQTALKNPDVAQFLTNGGFDPDFSTPAQFNAGFKAEFDLITGIIKDAGVQPE